MPFHKLGLQQTVQPMRTNMIPKCIVCGRKVYHEDRQWMAAHGLPATSPPVCQVDCLYAAEMLAEAHPDLAAAKAQLLAAGVDLKALTAEPTQAWTSTGASRRYAPSATDGFGRCRAD